MAHYHFSDLLVTVPHITFLPQDLGIYGPFCLELFPPPQPHGTLSPPAGLCSNVSFSARTSHTSVTRTCPPCPTPAALSLFPAFSLIALSPSHMIAFIYLVACLLPSRCHLWKRQWFWFSVSPALRTGTLTEWTLNKYLWNQWTFEGTGHWGSSFQTKAGWSYPVPVALRLSLGLAVDIICWSLERGTVLFSAMLAIWTLSHK